MLAVVILSFVSGTALGVLLTTVVLSVIGEHHRRVSLRQHRSYHRYEISGDQRLL